MFEEYKNIFYSYLTSFNRQETLNYSLKLLENKTMGVANLYEDVIGPSLGMINICRVEESKKIWKEHIMTGIVRTVVENCAPYVFEQKNPLSIKNSDSKVVVLCPEEEYHDIGARMGADFFIMENYEVFFVGANTPKSNIFSLCQEINPQYIAISASNFYYLAAVKAIIAQLNTMSKHSRIILSGSAFSSGDITAEQFGQCVLIQTYEQLKTFGGNEK